jgi:hypothetical protein
MAGTRPHGLRDGCWSDWRVRAMSMEVNKVLAGCLALASVLGLTGCDTSIFWGPAAIQRDGDQIVVVCQDIHVVQLYASNKNSTGSKPWSRFWEA